MTTSDKDLATAISALTAFLQNGSHTGDPQRFTEGQRQIERDFGDLLTGLGRDRTGRVDGPVLSTGLLQLRVPLPAEACHVGGYTTRRIKVWLVSVADATRSPGTPTSLRHKDIVTEGVVRLRVFDAAGRQILIGIPKIVQTAPTP